MVSTVITVFKCFQLSHDDYHAKPIVSQSCERRQLSLINLILQTTSFSESSNTVTVAFLEYHVVPKKRSIARDALISNTEHG